jgi:hypothetical protein
MVKLHVFYFILVNSVAASVWHRVRMKLEGKDVDRNAKQTVEEQVWHYKLHFKIFSFK